MSGSNSAYGQTQDFNKQLYDPSGRGAGLQNDFKNQLTEQSYKVAGAGGRRARNTQIKSFHEMIWNNPNIPNELKEYLANFAQYTPRGGSGNITAHPMAQGDGTMLANSMGARMQKRMPMEPAVAATPEPVNKQKRRTAVKPPRDVVATPQASKKKSNGNKRPPRMMDSGG